MPDWSHMFLEIEPRTKERPRHGKGFTYTPARTRKYEADLKRLMRISMGTKRFILTTPIELKIIVWLKAPIKNKRSYATVKPDVDNLLKSILDAGNGILWADDKQVVDCHIIKHETDAEFKTPGIQISIKELGNYPLITSNKS